MASAPRYSFGADQDMGDALYHPLLVGAALIGGWILPAHAVTATLMYEQGVPLEVISDTLRHAGLSITKVTIARPQAVVRVVPLVR